MEDTSMLEASQPLFQDLTFTIIPTSLSPDSVHELATSITACGGTVRPFDSSVGRIEKIKEIAFIISSTTDFPDYYRALDYMIHVVKPSWVEDCLQIGKVKNPRSFSPDPALFMNEVVVCCGDIPEGDQEAIAGGVIAMGGQYSATLSKMVTHLIALDMNEERCRRVVDKRIPAKIVLPHWFDDCLKVGRRLKERPYLLPDPEILKVEVGAIPATKTSPDIRHATNPEPMDEPVPSTPPVHLQGARAIRAFEGKTVKLATDLNLNKRLKAIITDLIAAGGGNITTDIDKANIYVCNFRDGNDYVKASQAKKDVGNLSWLYYLITHDTWTNPMRRMMHYPRPREGIKGFESYKISISSYTGEARVYLENLIKATGAEFTKTFKGDNTHLITAHKNSEKCDAAQEWGIEVINHLWLEDSYSKCEKQKLSDPRYTYFPPRTNLGEILGSTEIDRDAVESMFFPKTLKPTTAKAAPKGTTRLEQVPASSAALGRANIDRVARSSPLAEKTSRRATTVDDVATPARRFDGKENQTPGSRGAKDRANSKLRESADDIAKFEKEMKRKGGVIHGGRRQKEDEVPDKLNKDYDSASSKRPISEVEGDDATTEDELVEGPAKKNKKARKEKLTPIKYRMLLSKDERWQNNPDKESKEKARLRELGLFITDDFRKVDLLCAPKIVRTKKFVAALACGPMLVNSSFLDYALKHNKIPSPEKYPIEDRSFQKVNGFDIEGAIDRAKQNKHRLLKDWVIFCTSNVSGGFDTYNDIIVANGGRCQRWQGRTTKVTASKRKIDTQPQEVSQNLQEDDGDVLYLISEPKKSEIGLWKNFRELAAKHDMVPRIVKTEWLLYVAMAQYIHWDPEWELDEEAVNSVSQ